MGNGPRNLRIEHDQKFLKKILHYDTELVRVKLSLPTPGFGHPIFKHDFGSMYLGLKTLQVVPPFFSSKFIQCVAWWVMEKSENKWTNHQTSSCLYPLGFTYFLWDDDLLVRATCQWLTRHPPWARGIKLYSSRGEINRCYGIFEEVVQTHHLQPNSYV